MHASYTNAKSNSWCRSTRKRQLSLKFCMFQLTILMGILTLACAHSFAHGGIKDEHRRGPAGGSDLLIFTEISRDTAVERNPSFCALLGEDICREQHRIMTDDQARIVNAEQVPDPLFTADDLQ